MPGPWEIPLVCLLHLPVLYLHLPTHGKEQAMDLSFPPNTFFFSEIKFSPRVFPFFHFPGTIQHALFL